MPNLARTAIVAWGGQWAIATRSAPWLLGLQLVARRGIERLVHRLDQIALHFSGYVGGGRKHHDYLDSVRRAVIKQRLRCRVSEYAPMGSDNGAHRF
jgi:hypothetical protein